MRPGISNHYAFAMHIISVIVQRAQLLRRATKTPD